MGPNPSLERGPPPAWHLAREALAVIIRFAGQAPFRLRPLSSNVSRHLRISPCTPPAQMPPATPSFRSVLWVDDNPSNNTIAADYLAAIQTSVTKVHSTRQALAQLRVRSFDAIISDMGRWEGQYEGYVLLDEVRRQGMQTPFFIFAAGGGEPQHRKQAHERGANGSTNSMEELLDMVQRVFFS